MLTNLIRSPSWYSSSKWTLLQVTALRKGLLNLTRRSSPPLIKLWYNSQKGTRLGKSCFKYWKTRQNLQIQKFSRQVQSWKIKWCTTSLLSDSKSTRTGTWFYRCAKNLSKYFNTTRPNNSEQVVYLSKLLLTNQLQSLFRTLFVQRSHALQFTHISNGKICLEISFNTFQTTLSRRSAFCKYLGTSRLIVIMNPL